MALPAGSYGLKGQREAEGHIGLEVVGGAFVAFALWIAYLRFSRKKTS